MQGNDSGAVSCQKHMVGCSWASRSTQDFYNLSRSLGLLKFCCMEDTNQETFWLLNRRNVTLAGVPVCLALKLCEVQEAWYYSRKSCWEFQLSAAVPETQGSYKLPPRWGILPGLHFFILSVHKLWASMKFLPSAMDKCPYLPSLCCSETHLRYRLLNSGFVHTLWRTVPTLKLSLRAGWLLIKQQIYISPIFFQYFWVNYWSNIGKLIVFYLLVNRTILKLRN